jgi:hypothetical protein
MRSPYATGCLARKSNIIGVMRFHFERRNQVANLVDLAHYFAIVSQAQGRPTGKNIR